MNDVHYAGESFWNTSDERRKGLTREFGVLYQSGALWSSMTLSENQIPEVRAFLTRGEVAGAEAGA